MIVISSTDPAFGSSLDYFAGVFGMDLLFAFELRDRFPNGDYYGTLAPPSEIQPSGEELLQAFIGMTDKARELGYL